jgi:lauroyl/myristoyl acyltransferase
LLPLAGRLPFSWAQRIADLRGWIHYRTRTDSRNHARANIKTVFPELDKEEVERIVLAHYRTPARDEVEAYWYSSPLNQLSQFTRISGLDLLREAAESGSGVLLFSGHLGSTGLFFTFIGKHGLAMNIVGRSIDPSENPLHPSEWDFNKRRVAWIEDAVSNPFLLTGQGNYGRILEKLSCGETIMLLIDVVPTLTKRQVTVDFLGDTARFADGIASLYKQTEARLIHYVIRWDRSTNSHLIELVELTNAIPRSASKQIIMQSLANQVEKLIRLYPDHWWCWDSLSHFYPGGGST